MFENINYISAGAPLDKAKKVLVMLHGRGDSAANFIQFAEMFELGDFGVLALQADQNTWYPLSFLADVDQNQPYLDRSLGYIDQVVKELLEVGFNSQQIFIMGFSQGACLSLEYSTRHATEYGGVIAFTGGLIGKEIDLSLYDGNFNGTQVFIGSSDNDPHVPEYRIDESETIISKRGGSVTKKIYPGLGHTINKDEIEIAKQILHK